VRLWAPLAALAWVALAGSAWAQVLPGQSTTPAPAVDPGTKLAFPPSLGGAQMVSSSSQGAGGTSYAYSLNKMMILVSVFNNGRRVPSGSDTPQVMNQFKIELDEAESKIRTLGYGQFDRPTVPSTCVFGNVSFRCLVYSATGARGRLYSKLLMTGYRDYFIRIRIEWAQILGQTTADADAALKGFVSALLHGS
jgi:hypothetical protein